MSLVSVDTSEKNTAVLEIEIDRTRFAETVTKIFRAKAANITVPGFRKGKAPRVIIEKMYGKGLFDEEAVNELLPEAVEAAVVESKISPVAKPEIEVKSIDENGVFVTAKYTVKPEAEIKNYTGLEAKKTIVAVPDKAVDDEIAAIQKRNARSLEITDRAAETGDEVKIDYEGYVDGVPFEGGKGTDQKLKLGSGAFVAGFEEQIAGKNIGDEFEVHVTFPEDYPGEDVKGKDAVFKVKLNAIRYEELPELDDEFAKDVSEFDTLEQYRADVREKIKKRYDSRAEYSVEQQLTDGIIANLEADIPEIMIQNETERQIGEYAYRMQSQGIDWEMYMKYAGMDKEGLHAQFRPAAERQVKMMLALEKIAALENLAPSEEEIEQEYGKMAELYKLEVDKMKEQVDEAALKNELAVKKAVEFVKANANVTEIEQTLEEFEKELRESHRGHDHGDDDIDGDEDIDDFDDIDIDE